MNLRRWLNISLVFNLVFLLAGSFYLIHKTEFLGTQSQGAQRPIQSARPIGKEDFVATFDYQWQKQLFEEEPIQNGAVVFLGDSLTAGGLWQHVWRGKTPQPILNRGLIGDRMEGVIARIDEVMRHHPRKIFIMIGINDLKLEQKSPGDLTRQYVELLHTISERSPEAQIFLQSLLPVWGETNKAIIEVNQHLSEMADGSRVQYLDIHRLYTDSQGQLRKDWSFDGVHLRAIAYQKWREVVWPLID